MNVMIDFILLVDHISGCKLVAGNGKYEIDQSCVGITCVPVIEDILHSRS